MVSQFSTRLTISPSGHVVADSHEFRDQRRNKAVEVEYIRTCSASREKESGNATDFATIVDTGTSRVSDPEIRLARRAAIDRHGT